MLGDLSHLVQRLALPGSGGGDVIQGNGAGQAALVVLAVGVVLNFFSSDDLANVEAGLLRQLHGLLAGKLVTGVVQGQQQHAVALVRQLHGVKHQLAIGSSENIAHGLHVQHTLAHEARLGRLMAGATVSNDGNAVSVGQVLADDQMAVHIQNVGIGKAQAGQFLIGDGLGGVDKLFHFHMEFLPFKISHTMLRPAPARERNTPWT